MKTTITVKCTRAIGGSNEEFYVQVQAEIVGQYAVHKTAGLGNAGLWTVTHVVSGTSILGGIGTKKKAVELANRLAAVDLDKAWRDPLLFTPIAEQARQIVNEWAAEIA